MQEELKSIEDADNICSTFTKWISSAQKGFAEVTDGSEPQDRVAIERMMKKLEVHLLLFTYLIRGFLIFPAYQ